MEDQPIKVMGERILIEKMDDEPKEKKSKGGLVLAPGATPENNDFYVEAKVVAAGPEVKDISAGDTILFDKRAAMTIDIREKEYQMFNQSSVVAVL